MKVNVLIIHGAGQRAYKVMKDRWLPYVQKSLGPRYEVTLPEMPMPQFPQYNLWKGSIKKCLTKMKGPLILIGHSLGGTVLIKYLTEEAVKNQIIGLYLIASPYFSENKGWNYQDFYLHKNPDQLLNQFPVYSYHSTDDLIVPVSHQGFIAERLPQAVVRTLKGHGHEYNQKEFKEIIEDIKQLRLPLDEGNLSL